MKLTLRPNLLPPFVVALALTSSLLLTAVPAAEAASNAAGANRTEARQITDFQAIAIAGSFDLEVRQTGKESVAVQADAKVLPMIETVVESGPAGRTLHVRMTRGANLWQSGRMKVVVEVIKLKALVLAGSGDARLTGLDTDALEIRISGSGDVMAQGSARKLRLAIAGSGDAELTDLEVDDMTVSIAGSGDAKVTAHKSLTASVAGSGDIQYGGRATVIRSSVAGSGSIQKR